MWIFKDLHNADISLIAILWGGCGLNSGERNLAKSDKIISFKEKCQMSHNEPTQIGYSMNKYIEM